MSRDKSQPTALVPPVAVTTEDEIDNISIVDSDNMSVASELSEQLELSNPNSHDDSHDNNVNNDIVHRRGTRELNNLGPMLRSPRLRSGKRRM